MRRPDVANVGDAGIGIPALERVHGRWQSPPRHGELAAIRLVANDRRRIVWKDAGKRGPHISGAKNEKRTKSIHGLDAPVPERRNAQRVESRLCCVFLEYSMAPRANWKGYLRLSLVSCPILLYPAISESEKIRFNQINKATGHRIKMQKVDEATGDVVDNDDIVKGYKAGNGYVEITDDDLEAIEVESTRTIDIDQFVPRDEIDDLYIDRP
jgi:Ku70/Ku80 beta-barrel domain